MKSGEGFLLIEACLGLVLVGIFSSLLFIWQGHCVKTYEVCRHELKVLCVARSLLEKVKAGYSFPPDFKISQYDCSIKKLAISDVPGFRYVTISLAHCKNPQKPLVTLKTGVAYE